MEVNAMNVPHKLTSVKISTQLLYEVCVYAAISEISRGRFFNAALNI